MSYLFEIRWWGDNIRTWIYALQSTSTSHSSYSYNNKDSNNKIDVNNIINAINSRTKMIFVTIPTNLATSFLTIHEINHLARLLIPTNIILILDMSCSECIDDDRYSIKTFINTFIIKTLSSTYDLVSFSLGWMHCNRKTVSMIKKKDKESIYY